MFENTYQDILADLSQSYAVLRACITLACVWLFVDLLRGAPWASTGLKVVISVSAATTGLLFYPRIGACLTGTARLVVYGWAAAFLVAAVIGLADTFARKTKLRLPESGWSLTFVLASVILGISFPAIEAIAGRSSPSFQAFGLAPAPFVLVALPLIAASGPGSLLRTVWLLAAFLAAADSAFVSWFSGYPYAHPLAAVAVVASGLLAAKIRRDGREKPAGVL